MRQTAVWQGFDNGAASISDAEENLAKADHSRVCTAGKTHLAAGKAIRENIYIDA